MASAKHCGDRVQAIYDYMEMEDERTQFCMAKREPFEGDYWGYAISNFKYEHKNQHGIYYYIIVQ